MVYVWRVLRSWSKRLARSRNEIPRASQMSAISTRSIRRSPNSYLLTNPCDRPSLRLNSPWITPASSRAWRRSWRKSWRFLCCRALCRGELGFSIATEHRRDLTCSPKWIIPYWIMHFVADKKRSDRTPPSRPQTRRRKSPKLYRPPGSFPFPDVRGKVVADVYLTMKIGLNCVTLCFDDNTELVVDIEPFLSFTASYSDWKTGNQRVTKRWPRVRGK